MFRIEIHPLSFWLGFLAASLLWWLVGKIRPLLPGWRDHLRNTVNTIRQQNLAGVEQHLRRDTLRRAQAMHLAAPLFSLDEIVQQPWLLAPPMYGEVTAINDQIPLAAQVIPYLPDWPEFTTQVAVPKITLAQALQHGRDLVLIGEPGSGKTVALAHAAAQISRNAPEVSALQNAVPVFLHVLDLPAGQETSTEPLTLLMAAAMRGANPLLQAQAVRFARAALQTRRMIVLLDGCEEVPPERARSAAAALAALKQKYPRVQIAAAGSAAAIQPWIENGFLAISLAGWTRAQRDAHTARWHELWMSSIQPGIDKANPGEFDPIAIPRWLSSEEGYVSPLEWTVRIWSAYAGDASGSATSANLSQCIVRYLPDTSTLPALSEIAAEMVRLGTGSITTSEADRRLSAAQPASISLPAGESRDRKQNSVFAGNSLLQSLLDAGVLVEHSGETLRFASTVITGYLAASALTDADVPALLERIAWTPAEQALHWFAAQSQASRWATAWLQDDTPPLYTKLLRTARWLKDAPATAEWRTQVLRKLAALTQRRELPLSMNMRAAAALVLSRDPNIAAFFRQQLGKAQANGRCAALMGSAASANPEVLPAVLDCLNDPDPLARMTACYALAALPGPAARDAIETILREADEMLRQAAAETLADAPGGFDALRAAAADNDLLTRRAAVFGLIQVHQPWAQAMLEKIAVEDGQWVVRNAAAQALEHNPTGDPGNWFQIQPLPAPWEANWLLKAAAREGRGLTPNQPATDLMLSVLKTGSPEDQRAALLYLRTQPDPGIIRAIYHLLYGSTDENVREAAIEALWWVTLRGITLPDPAEYGLG